MKTICSSGCHDNHAPALAAPAWAASYRWFTYAHSPAGLAVAEQEVPTR